MKKHFGLVAGAAILLSAVNRAAAMKYQKGDCITPTDKSYSWFGKFARVEAVSAIGGYVGLQYVLAFPSSVSNSVLFSIDIEANTKVVDKAKCAPR